MLDAKELQAVEQRLRDGEKFFEEMTAGVIALPPIELSPDPVAAGGPRYLGQKLVEVNRLMLAVWKWYRDVTFKAAACRKLIGNVKGLLKLNGKEVRGEEEEDTISPRLEAILQDAVTLLKNFEQVRGILMKKYSESHKYLEVIRDQEKIVGWEWSAATHKPVAAEDLDDIFKDKDKPVEAPKTTTPLATAEPEVAKPAAKAAETLKPTPTKPATKPCGGCGKPATKTVVTAGKEFPICDACETRQSSGATPAKSSTPVKAPPAKPTETPKSTTPAKPTAPSIMDDLSEADLDNVTEKAEEGVEVGGGGEITEGDLDDVIESH